MQPWRDAWCRAGRHCRGHTTSAGAALSLPGMAGRCITSITAAATNKTQRSVADQPASSHQAATAATHQPPPRQGKNLQLPPASLPSHPAATQPTPNQPTFQVARRHSVQGARAPRLAAFLIWILVLIRLARALPCPPQVPPHAVAAPRALRGARTGHVTVL